MSIVYHTGIPSIYKIFYYDFYFVSDSDSSRGRELSLSVLLDQLPEFLIALKEVVF